MRAPDPVRPPPGVDGPSGPRPDGPDAPYTVSAHQQPCAPGTLRLRLPIRLTDESAPPRGFSEETLQKEIDEKFALYETLEPGWDSYSAEPVSRDSLSDARRFLEMRPKDIQLPHPQLGSDGIVSFYWTARHVFASLSLDGGGLLSYYAQEVDGDDNIQEFFGEDRPFTNGWPRELLMILPRK